MARPGIFPTTTLVELSMATTVELSTVISERTEEVTSAVNERALELENRESPAKNFAAIQIREDIKLPAEQLVVVRAYPDKA